MAINLSKLPDGVKRGPKLDMPQAEEKAKKMNLELPKDLVGMLQQSNGMAIKGEKGKITFLPYSKILDLWAGQNKTHEKADPKADEKVEADNGVAKAWWNKAWVPFAKINGADYYCLDMAPSAGGVKGQVILFRTGKPRRQIIAKSLEEFITMVMGKLK